ncbi:MAG: VOC family protein, partial [Pseudonocardiaceae bacterium]
MCSFYGEPDKEAMEFYTKTFPDGKIISAQKMPDGQMMMGEFEVMGQRFSVLNAGPRFKFNEAVSFFVNCQDQAEVDKYYDAILEGGGEEGQCGWIKDKFGLWWQIIPKQLGELMGDPDRDKAGRAMQA